MAEAFLGRGWAFPVGVSDTGGIRTRSGEDDIREAVGIILTTRLGERVMRPEYGCAAGDLVFGSNASDFAGRVEFFIRKALERWEPRIDVKEVSVISSEAKVDVDVRYAVRATNREDNVVVPFFAGEMP